MKRFLLTLGILLLLVGQGWGYGPEPGTESYFFYVTPTGTCTTSAGDSPAGNVWADNTKCFASVAAVITYINANRLEADTKCIYVKQGYTITADTGISNVKSSNLTITGALGVGAKDASESVRDTIVFTPSASQPFKTTSTVHDISIMNLSINAGVYGIDWSATGGGMLIRYCKITPLPASTACIRMNSASSGHRVTRNIIYMPSLASAIIWGSCTGQVDLNVIQPLINVAYGAKGVAISGGSAAADIYFNTILGSQADAISNSASGTNNIKNNFLDYGHFSGGYGVNSATGTSTVTYNYIQSSPIAPQQAVLNIAGTDSNNIKSTGRTSDTIAGNPKFKSVSRLSQKGIIVPCIDDPSNISIVPVYDGTANDWSTALGNRGLKGTLALIGNQTLGNITLSRLRSMISAGIVEAGSHSWAHNNGINANYATLGYTGTTCSLIIDYTAHTVSVSGNLGDSATCNLQTDNTYAATGLTVNVTTSGANTIFTISGGDWAALGFASGYSVYFSGFTNPQNNGWYSISSATSSALTCTGRTGITENSGAGAITALGDCWAFVLNYLNQNGGSSRYSLSVGTNSLASKVTSVAAGTYAKGAILLFDQAAYNSGFYNAELVNNKTFLEGLINTDPSTGLTSNLTDPQTGATYVCNSFICPYDNNTATYKAAQLNGGHTGARDNHAPNNFLSFDLYDQYMSGVTTTNVIGSNDNDTYNRTKSLCFSAGSNGQVIYILGHTTTVAQWTPILNALKEMQDNGIVQVTSMQTASNIIRSSPWTYTVSNGGTSTATGISAISTFTSYVDCRLTPNSPLIRAGTPITVGENNLGLTKTLDVYGNTVSASAPNIGADQNQYGGGGLSPGLGISGGNVPPWVLRH